MKTYSNEKLIKRNSRIGNIASLLAIAILGVGMFFSFKDSEGQYITLTFSCLIVGFLMFQVGNYYMSKFGKSPRPDETLSAALKGLDDKYNLYHYQTVVSHLLIGPSGIYCLIPFNQAGSISYNSDKKRWKQTGGNFFLKTFGGESLGRPELDANYAVMDAKKYFAKKGIELDKTTPESILVFTNEKASVSTEGYEGLAVTSSKIKELIRKRAKNNPVPPELIDSIHGAIESGK